MASSRNPLFALALGTGPSISRKDEKAAKKPKKRIAFSWLTWLAALFLFVTPRFTRAEHFDIKLVAADANGVTQEAYADQSPPAFGLNPRPVLKARAGNTMTVQFIMTNVYPHGMAKGAGVHYYVVREKNIGQKTLPPLANPVAEGTFTFDLKPKARIGVREHFVIRDPGIYLLRVESARTQRDHEHFSAIDLQIE